MYKSMKNPKQWEQFDKSKRYKFTKEAYIQSYLLEPEITASDIEQLANQGWVNVLNGKEVIYDEKAQMVGELLGYEDNTVWRNEWFIVPRMWCEEIKEDM